MNKLILFLLIALVAVQINARPADPAKTPKKDAKGAEDQTGDAAKKAEEAAKKAENAAKPPKKEAGLAEIVPDTEKVFADMVAGGIGMFANMF